MSDAAGGTVFVVSAPSGAGKTTLCRRLLDHVPGLVFSVSLTTRPARAGERGGVDYVFVSPEEFENRRLKGDLLEWAVVDGRMYGTSDSAVRDAVDRGTDILLDVDTQGAASIRRLMPGAVLVFIMPPGPEALRERLARRGTEGPEGLARRLGLARGEVLKWPMYDFVVINDDLEAAYDHLRAIVLSARCRAVRQAERLATIAARFRDPQGTPP
jgi:guanylate kinase